MSAFMSGRKPLSIEAGMSFLSTFGKGTWTAAAQALGASAPKFVKWGTGSGGGVDSIDLVAPASEARVVGVASLVSTTTLGDTLRVVATLVATEDQTITEIGTFQSMSGADLCTYLDFVGIPLKTGDSVTFTIDTQLAA
jgi:hypothetical protein